MFAALRTSDLVSVATSSTVSIRSTSGAPSPLARLNDPPSPAPLRIAQLATEGLEPAEAEAEAR